MIAQFFRKKVNEWLEVQYPDICCAIENKDYSLCNGCKDRDICEELKEKISLMLVRGDL